MTQVSGASTSSPTIACPSGSTSTTATGNCYDGAGNVTADLNHAYTYDGESRLCAVRGPDGMIGYQYDADGNRIGKGTVTNWQSCDLTANGYVPTTDYVLDQGGGQMSEVAVGNGQQTWTHTNVTANGMLIATYDALGAHFYLNDALGSRRVQTDAAGFPEQTCQSLPFGNQLYCTGSLTSPTEHHFTGKERDSESGLDDFGARYYASTMGRFMSPDSNGYSGLTNPQSWNLYAYTLNNPLRYDDPTGHTVECKTDAAGCLSAAQAAVGSDAAGQLTTQTTTTQNWLQKIFGLSTTTTTLQITGDEAHFRGASSNASKLADLVDSKTNFGFSVATSSTPTWTNPMNNFIYSGGDFGGGITYTGSQNPSALPEAFIKPYPQDTEAQNENIPQANAGEAFAHEMLGHLWGEYFNGHNQGTAANKLDAVHAENAVRATDPTRGQKQRHDSNQ